ETLLDVVTVIFPPPAVVARMPPSGPTIVPEWSITMLELFAGLVICAPTAGFLRVETSPVPEMWMPSLPAPGPTPVAATAIAEKELTVTNVLPAKLVFSVPAVAGLAASQSTFAVFSPAQAAKAVCGQLAVTATQTAVNAVVASKACRTDAALVSRDAN